MPCMAGACVRVWTNQDLSTSHRCNRGPSLLKNASASAVMWSYSTCGHAMIEGGIDGWASRDTDATSGGNGGHYCSGWGKPTSSRNSMEARYRLQVSLMFGTIRTAGQDITDWVRSKLGDITAGRRYLGPGVAMECWVLGAIGLTREGGERHLVAEQHRNTHARQQLDRHEPHARAGSGHHRWTEGAG